MQIILRLYRFLIVCSVLGLYKGFLKLFFRGMVLMDCVILDYGFFLFGLFKQVSEFLGLFLLFVFGMKFLYSDRFSRVLVRFLYDLRGKQGELKFGFFSNGKKFGTLKEKSNPNDSDSSVGKVINSDSDDGFDSEEIDFESDVSKLRRLIEIQRHRGNVALAELAKERAASASAAEEAMRMILRLQNEKSLVELESSQYKRLAEEKQIHDQEVIRSLRWLVWRHESGRSLLEDRLKLYRQKRTRCSSRDECEELADDEEAEGSFDGNILDALENVLYSSRE